MGEETVTGEGIKEKEMSKLTRAIIIKSGEDIVEIRYSDGIDKSKLYRVAYDIFYPDYGDIIPRVDLNIYETSIPEVLPDG